MRHETGVLSMEFVPIILLAGFTASFCPSYDEQDKSILARSRRFTEVSLEAGETLVEGHHWIQRAIADPSGKVRRRISANHICSHLGLLMSGDLTSQPASASLFEWKVRSTGTEYGERNITEWEYSLTAEC